MCVSRAFVLTRELLVLGTLVVVLYPVVAVLLLKFYLLLTALPNPREVGLRVVSSDAIERQ